MFFLLLSVLFIVSNASKTNITIYRITASTDISSATADIVQQIAIEEINNNPSILRDYELNLQVLDSYSESEKALEHAITTSQLFSQCSLQNNSSSLISPIVSGAPWSAFSVLTSRVFNIYHLLQISASATSPALSEKHKYSSFFRTIANDNLQGKAIIKLCKQFSWTRIGVVYRNDNYGQNFNKVIQEEADKNEIEIHSKSFIPTDADSIKTAATFIKGNKLYITILVAQGADIYKLFKYETFNYPFYFIGTDAWFDQGELIEHNISNQTVGYIGTIPGNPSMFTIDEYIKNNIYNGNMTIYNISNTIYKRVINKISNKMNDSTQLKFSISFPTVGYAYDAMYALAYALHIYDNMTNYSLKYELAHCRLEDVSNKLKVVLNNMSEFIGITGPVQFKNGDRVNGTFAYGFVKNDSEIEIFGNFANEYEDNYINITQITYSDMFEQFNQPPRSNKCTDKIGDGIKANIVGIIGGFYGFICLMVFALVYTKRNENGNVVYFSMNIGLILCFILIVSYGLQKNKNIYCVKNEYPISYDIWCLSNFFILCIAFTFTFLAFITAQSELMRIIVKFMRKQQLSNYRGDKIIYKKLLNCLIFDIIILLAFIIAYFVVYFKKNIKLLQYKFIKIGNEEGTYDLLQNTQKMYPICQSHWSTNIFYAILSVYKIIQIMYSIDNSVGLIISYMILIVCIFCIGLIIVSWYTLNQMFLNNQIDQDVQYSILSIIIIFIYLLWIIPEYYYLCKKYLGYNTDESSTKTTTTTTPNDILISNDQNVIEYDHLTASQHDNICKIENKIHKKKENKKELNKSNLIVNDDEKLKLMKHGSLSGNITDIDKHELTITPMELQSGASLSDGRTKKIIKTIE